MKYYIFLILTLIVTLNACKMNTQPNPLKINTDELIGISTPFEKWQEWGYPETLEGTDNRYWAIYLEKANLTLITRKSEQRVVHAQLGRKGYLKVLNELP